jgi:hypothetical protein
MPGLTRYQKQVLVAMKALADRGHEYVTGESIAWVLSPYGGLRDVTLVILEAHGIIRRQIDDLPYEVKVHLLCSCAKHRWRLTDLGIDLADSFRVKIDPPTLRRLDTADGILCRMREWARDDIDG